MLKVFVPRERTDGETRVAVTPAVVKSLVKNNLEVHVEAGAGSAAHFVDDAYKDAGAKLVADGDVSGAWSDADLVLKVVEATADEAAQLKAGAVLISLLIPHQHLDLVKVLSERKVSTLSMNLVPRISRAQSMDALSSQASIAGYKAALLAAANLDKYFPLLMTAAGTIKPARVVVMGAGVAGLQALATCKRLGAVVEVSDIREAVKEEVESLGGKFIDLPMKESGEGKGGYARQMSEEFLRKQKQIVAERVKVSDVVITTALVPGRPAPKLVSAQMVEDMREGAVIIDLAVAQGGNCELSERDQTVVKHGVTIIGPSNLPASLPFDASNVYARNILSLLDLIAPKGELKIDLEDEIVDGALLTHDGKVRHAQTAEALGLDTSDDAKDDDANDDDAKGDDAKDDDAKGDDDDDAKDDDAKDDDAKDDDDDDAKGDDDGDAKGDDDDDAKGDDNDDAKDDSDNKDDAGHN